MTLISWRARPETSTELVSRKVCTMVSTWVARTMRLQDRVLLVGPDELGALEGHPGLVGAQAEDHLDVGLGLEGLGHAAAPEGVQPGDQDPSAHGSAEPDAAALAQHVVERVLELGPDRLGLVHHPAPRVPLLIRAPRRR